MSAVGTKRTSGNVRPMSAVRGIVLHNSVGFDCWAFMSSSRPLVYALPFVCCGCYSQVSMRGKQLPEVAGRGR